MSTYFVRGKGWRYDFTQNGNRYTNAWFKTKSKAKEAEAKRKEEMLNPQPEKETPTDMGFLELLNRRLDHIRAYNSASHYRDHVYLARRWAKEWKHLHCGEISTDMVEKFVLKRSRVSGYTANRELRCLRSLFNFGMKRGWIKGNPTQHISFFPVEKKVKYVPPREDVLRVVMAADRDTQDYLWCIMETMARMGEVNRLAWEDVNFQEEQVTLYTRKKKGGHLTPRQVPMTEKLFQILSRRHKQWDKRKPWVFCHRYWDRKKKEWVEGPYQERKRVMATLCRKAGVRYFRFHPLRHLGASTLDRGKVNIGSIQRILGHESRRTTEIYLHSIGEAEREAMRIYEKMTEDSHTESHTETGKGLTHIGQPLDFIGAPGPT